MDEQWKMDEAAVNIHDVDEQKQVDTEALVVDD